MRRFGLPHGILIGLAGAALAAALFPASAARRPESNYLLHPPRGLAVPETLGELRRVTVAPGDPSIGLYVPVTPVPGDKRMLAIAVGRARAAPGRDRMRDQSRGDAAKAGTLETVTEGPFGWPGHPAATTFHGAYAAGEVRKEYWHAADGGYGIMVIATTGRSEPEAMAAISAAVAAGMFGGATAAPAASVTSP
jgi:hypothetical protein